MSRIHSFYLSSTVAVAVLFAGCRTEKPAPIESQAAVSQTEKSTNIQNRPDQGVQDKQESSRTTRTSSSASLNDGELTDWGRMHDEFDRLYGKKIDDWINEQNAPIEIQFQQPQLIQRRNGHK